MGGRTLKIQENLNRCALIIRKYNLADKQYFLSLFQDFSKSSLETSWTLAIENIQKKEIIKDAPVSFTILYKTEIDSALINFGDNVDAIYRFLNSNFDIKALKFRDEIIQRRIRNKLAKVYLNKITIDTKRLNFEKQSSYSIRFKNVVKKYALLIAIFLLIAAFSTPRIIEGLTPTESLLNKYIHEKYKSIKGVSINKNILGNYLYEDSKYKFSGAICNDGWISHSQGRGTCSYHGGVAYYFDEGTSRKSLNECRQEAVRIIEELKKKAFQKSWRD